MDSKLVLYGEELELKPNIKIEPQDEVAIDELPCSVELMEDPLGNIQNPESDCDFRIEYISPNPGEVTIIKSEPNDTCDLDPDDPDFNSMDSQLNTNNVDGPKQLKCEFCDDLFCEATELEQHLADHDVNIGFKCNNCEMFTRNLSFFLSHRKHCPFETDAGLMCTICHKIFTSIRELYRHRYSAKHFQPLINYQTDKFEYFCEKCPEIFEQLNNFMEHADDFHSKKNKPNKQSRSYICEVCGKGYNQSSHLYQHLRFHKGIKPFQCTFESCLHRFTIRPDLNDHIRKYHTGERPYKCTDCPKTFLTGSVYYQHRLIHQNVRRYHCDMCEKSFYRSDALKNHKRTHSGEKPCPRPSSACSNPSNPDEVIVVKSEPLNTYDVPDEQFCFENDSNSIDSPDAAPTVGDIMFDGSKPLKCEFCDDMFCEVSELEQHLGSHDVNIGFKCNICEIFTRNLSFFLSHRKHCRFDIATELVCTTCDRRFTSMKDLYKHRYSATHFQPLFNYKTDQLEYFCEKCPEIFEKFSNFLEHSNDFHSKKNKADKQFRSHVCEVCGKTFNQSSHLYQHLRFHKGIKPFQCTFESCLHRFTIRPDLNDHIRKYHTGERPYKCKECSKSFLTGSVYYQHRLIHKNVRRFHCEICDKRFYRADTLKNHKLIHTNEKPYPCSACSKSFRQKGDRDKHFRARHHHIKILKK